MIRPGLVIAIPAFDEEHLPITLQSLCNCLPAKSPVLVLTCINFPQSDDAEIRQRASAQFKALSHEFGDYGNGLHFQFLLKELPDRDAGVGMARKILVDYCQEHFGVSIPELPIISLDADCTVAENYLQALENHFHQNPKSPGASIYFEHNIEEAPDVEAIMLYELFLRYYIEELRFAGYPWAYHTIGSSMAVRLGIYAKQGGMNRRKAGEDFYLLNKVIPLGGFTEVNDTIVFPSARQSLRVPFGTGRAMKEWTENPDKLLKVYHPAIFSDLKMVFDAINAAAAHHTDFQTSNLWPEHLLESLRWMGFWEKYRTACENSATLEMRYLRFWRSLDLFFVRKWVHCLRDLKHGLMGINEVASSIFGEAGTNHELLMAYRKRQKNG